MAPPAGSRSRCADAPDFVALIPARLASTRLPDKPLADIGGRPMVVRVAERAAAAGAARVAVATDSQRIADAVAAADAQLRSSENTLRRPGVMAAAVDVPDDADPQTRLLAFTGRRV